MGNGGKERKKAFCVARFTALRTILSEDGRRGYWMVLRATFLGQQSNGHPTIHSVLQSGNHNIRYPLCPEGTLHNTSTFAFQRSCRLFLSAFVECYPSLLWEFECIQSPSNVKSGHECYARCKRLIERVREGAVQPSEGA